MRPYAHGSWEGRLASRPEPAKPESADQVARADAITAAMGSIKPGVLQPPWGLPSRSRGAVANLGRGAYDVLLYTEPSWEGWARCPSQDGAINDDTPCSAAALVTCWRRDTLPPPSQLIKLLLSELTAASEFPVL